MSSAAFLVSGAAAVPAALPAAVPAAVPAAGPPAVPTAAPSAVPSPSSTAVPSAVPENDFSALVFPLLGGHASGARGGRDADRARLEQQWRARGHAAGYTEGLRAAEQVVADQIRRLDAEHAHRILAAQDQVDRMLSVLKAAARALDARTLPVLRDAEDTVLEAAFALAEAIVGHALADESAAARSALGRAIGEDGGAGAGGLRAAHTALHTVRLHPDDLAVLDPAVTAAAGVVCVADPGIERGDAVSEFPDGYLDARIGSALERARAALGGDS